MHSQLEVYQNECQLTKVCFTMEKRGVLINPLYVKEALKHEHELIQEAKQGFEADTGRPYKDSSKLFASIFTERGENFPTTAKGNPSFAADTLELLDTPTTRLIKKVREHEKIAGTYYTSFLYYADEHNRIHPDMRQAGTTTGRFSYSRPNLQNVPKEDEESDLAKKFVVRGSFIPPQDFVYISLDYSQQEYRMLFDYAGETEIIKKILVGEDVHEATAKMVGITRKQAKTLNFAIIYGAGIEKLSKMLGITVKEAEDLRTKYFAKFPQVRRLLRYIPKVGQARGFIRNWFGRRCYLQDPEFAYVLPNHLIQGGCADVIKVAMVKIDEYLRRLKSGMVLQVHDELLFELHKEELGIIPDLMDIMETVYPPQNGMRLEVSANISKKSWATRDMEKWDAI